MSKGLSPSPWQGGHRVLIPLLCLALVPWLFHDTAAAMVAIWIRSETFQHAFLVPPIVAWLIWRRREALQRAPIHPEPAMLAAVAVVVLLWMLGELAEVAAAAHFALVSLMVMAVPTLFGWGITRVLAFPLLFAYFAVPFGEFAVPYLQEWTADVTVLALRLTGIPVYREGLQFVIPSGTWSVVEACSGIRYLIACFMVGTLYAYLNFRSTKRRLIFTVAALIVPVLANWIRAYTIVMIGHLTGSPMILGVEHTTYGWFLFGIVVMAMFAYATRWAEGDGPAAVDSAAPPAQLLPRSPSSRLWPVLVAYAAILVGGQFWLWNLSHAQDLPRPALTLPEGMAGWGSDARETPLAWQPAFARPDATLSRLYRDGDRRVTVWVAYYRQQDADRKLVSSVNRVVEAEDPNWRYQATGRAPAADGLPPFEVGIVSSGGAPTLGHTERQRVWHVYWLNGRWTTNRVMAKIAQATDRLAGRGDDGAVLLLVTPLSDDADATLAKFARAHVESIGGSLSATREFRP